MTNKTALYDCHVAAGAKLVDFASWRMPIHYGSQIEEHHSVRQHAGMFDVSHMVIWEIEGEGSGPFLSNLLANNVGRLSTPGKALYGCMLNEQGGVIDDLITYYLSPTHYRIITNAATLKDVSTWMEQQVTAFTGVTITHNREWSMLAVQGPEARDQVHGVLSSDQGAAVAALGKFHGVEIDGWFIARTGYTGEDGYELLLPHASAVQCWQALIANGVRPCGLGARDTLRLEAGLNLYGQDMDTTTSPLVSNLAWTVAFEPSERQFIGRQALEAERSKGVEHQLIGIKLTGKGVLRHNQRVIINGAADGVVTSGSYSPTLAQSIGLARVPKTTQTHCQVEIRGALVPAEIVSLPFVRR